MIQEIGATFQTVIKSGNPQGGVITGESVARYASLIFSGAASIGRGSEMIEQPNDVAL